MCIPPLTSQRNKRGARDSETVMGKHLGRATRNFLAMHSLQCSVIGARYLPEGVSTQAVAWVTRIGQTDFIQIK